MLGSDIRYRRGEPLGAAGSRGGADGSRAECHRSAGAEHTAPSESGSPARPPRPTGCSAHTTRPAAPRWSLLPGSPRSAHRPSPSPPNAARHPRARCRERARSQEGDGGRAARAEELPATDPQAIVNVWESIHPNSARSHRKTPTERQAAT